MAALSETVSLPSLRRLHVWGGKHGLGSHPGQLAPISPSFPASRARAEPTRRTQHTISLSYPLTTRSDNVINAPRLWARRAPDPFVLEQLNGGNANANFHRLGVYDRTCKQIEQDVDRETVYTHSYSKPVAMRLPPILGKREMQFNVS